MNTGYNSNFMKKRKLSFIASSLLLTIGANNLIAQAPPLIIDDVNKAFGDSSYEIGSMDTHSKVELTNYAQDFTLTNNGKLSAQYNIISGLLSGTSKVINNTSGEIRGSLSITADSTSSVFENRGKFYVNDYYIEMRGGSIVLKKDSLVQLQFYANTVSAHSPAILNRQNTAYSNIKADQITIEDGAKLDIKVINLTDKALLKDKTISDVIKAETNLIGEASYLKVSDDSALLDFEAIKDGNSINLKTVEVKTISKATSIDKRAASNAAKVLDKMKEQGKLSKFIAGLNKKSTDKEVAKAVKETTPVVAAALVNTSTQIQQTIGSVVSGRQLGIRSLGGTSTAQTGANSGDFLNGDYSAWSKLFGSKAKQDDKDGFDGYEFDSYGMAFGADKEFGDNKRFGLAFVYANGDVDTNNVDQSSDLNIYNLVAYGSTPIIDDNTIFFYQVSLGAQDTKTYRKENTTGTTAKGDFTGYIGSATARVLRNIKIDDKLLISPTAKATYTYMKNPSYKESGAGALNLEVDKFSSSTFTLGLGADLEYKLNKEYTFVSNAMVNYDLKEGDNVSSSSYTSNSDLSFNTQGMDNSRFSYEAGLGLKKQISEDMDLRFDYSYEGRDSSFSNQSVSFKLSWKF